MISCLIPITIKLYSSFIRAKEWLIDIEHNKDALQSTDLLESQNDLSEEKMVELIKPLIENFEKELSDLKNIDNLNQEKIDILFENKIKQLNVDIEKQISSSYQKNQDLFLKQFDNKIKVLTEKYINQIKWK